MKKIICMILCVLLLSALAATAFAAGSATITLTPSKMNPAHGEEVTFTVSISEVLNCKAAGIVVAYDTKALELVSGECLVNAFMSNFDASTGNGELAFTSGTTLHGDIFRFTFRVKENANVANDAIVSVRPSVRDTEGAVECQTASLALDVICTHEYGTWNSLNDDQHGRTCTKCGDVVKENHTWDEGKTEIEASCQQGGLVIYTCTGWTTPMIMPAILSVTMAAAPPGSRNIITAVIGPAMRISTGMPVPFAAKRRMRPITPRAILPRSGMPRPAPNAAT